LINKVLETKKRIRKTLGFYYRFIKQYYKNKQVFKSIKNLDEYALTYFSVLKNEDVNEIDVLHRIESGDVIIVKNLIAQLNLESEFQALSKEYFDLDYDELKDIHTIKSVEQIVDDALRVRHSVPNLILQSSIMKRLLKPHVEKLFLELQPNLRLHLPYKNVKSHEAYIESRMGRGKLNPHGQHKDSWRYHPQNTINVWVSLTKATDKNGLAILPQSADYQPKFNDKLQEIETGVKTYPSQQWVTQMEPGDAIIFQAELVHGSIINMTEHTRVALSMRCTPTEPDFHKKVAYNYIKIENESFDNLSQSKLSASGNFSPLCKDTCFGPAEKKQSSIAPVEYNEKYIKLNVKGAIKQFPRYCPHAGTDLLNGELNESGELLCPSHRMCIKGKESH